MLPNLDFESTPGPGGSENTPSATLSLLSLETGIKMVPVSQGLYFEVKLIKAHEALGAEPGTSQVLVKCSVVDTVFIPEGVLPFRHKE